MDAAEAEPPDDFAARRAAAQARMAGARGPSIARAIATSADGCTHERLIDGGAFDGCCFFCGKRPPDPLAFVRPPAAPIAPRPPAPEPRATNAHRHCKVCGQLGHNARSPIHRGEAPPPKAAPIHQRDRRCTVCGEAGHRANNARHRAPAAPPPEPRSDAGEPGPSRPHGAGWPHRGGRWAGHVKKTPAPRPVVFPEERRRQRSEAAKAQWAAVRAAKSLAVAAAPSAAIDAHQENPTPAQERIRRRLPVVDGKGRPHGRTIPARRLSREEQRVAEEDDYPDVDRPQTRGDCVDGPRPCPFVSCAHHLFLDVNEETGAIKLNFPHLDPDQMKESCSLDVSDRGGITLEEVGEFANITRERVRQIETRGLAKLRRVGGDDLGPMPERPVGYEAAG